MIDFDCPESLHRADFDRKMGLWIFAYCRRRLHAWHDGWGVAAAPRRGGSSSFLFSFSSSFLHEVFYFYFSFSWLHEYASKEPHFHFHRWPTDPQRLILLVALESNNIPKNRQIFEGLRYLQTSNLSIVRLKVMIIEYLRVKLHIHTQR